MQSKIVLGIVVAAMVVFFAVVGFSRMAPQQDNSNVDLANSPVVKSADAIPNAAVEPVPSLRSSFRLVIPKIKVDTGIEVVGLTPAGAVDVPKSLATVGWFNRSPRPGDIGSSVIDGHFGLENRVVAVFNNLHTLEPGDTIYVEDGKGTPTAFVVRATRTYGKDDQAPDVFGSTDGKAHLNLITCEGTWNETIKSYSDRLVVFADKQ